jgi:predicted metal-dependent peptidase
MNTNTIDPTSFSTNHPFSVAMRSVSRYWFLCHSKLMSMGWQWSDAVPYGATDGATLLLNRNGIDKLAAKPNGSGLIAFLLVHEALHALLGHGWRLAKMPDAHTANVAADYIINAMIARRNAELNKEVFPLIEGVLLDEQLSGDDSVEQLYRKLTKPQQKQDPNDTPPTNPNPNPNPTPNPKQNDTSNDTSNDGDQEGEGDEQDGDPQDSGDSGSSDGGDNPSDTDSTDGNIGDDDKGTSEDDLSDFVGTGAQDNFEPQAEDGKSQQEKIDEIEEANDSVLIADEIDRRQQNDSGTTASRVKSQRTNTSGLSWPDLLREWLTKRSRNGWDAPFNNPIFQTTGLISAGRRTRNAGEIVLVLDTSGSIGQATYNRFLQEAQAVLDDLKPERMHLLSVSHVVADAVSLQAGDMVPDKLKGGGGTLFKPAFNWVRDNAHDVDVMVYLTDGESNDLPDITDVEFPLLWLSTYTQPKHFKCGEVIMIPPTW